MKVTDGMIGADADCIPEVSARSQEERLDMACSAFEYALSKLYAAIQQSRNIDAGPRKIGGKN